MNSCRTSLPGYQAPRNWFKEEMDIVEHLETKFFEQFDDRANKDARELANEVLTDLTPVTLIMENFIMDIAASSELPEVPQNLVTEIVKALKVIADRNIEAEL